MVVTPQDTFLTLDEAAEALGMHPATLRAHPACSRLGVKLGKEWRFLASRCINFIQEEIEAKWQPEPRASTRGVVRGTRMSGSATAELAAALALARIERRREKRQTPSRISSAEPNQ